MKRAPVFLVFAVCVGLVAGAVTASAAPTTINFQSGDGNYPLDLSNLSNSNEFNVRFAFPPIGENVVIQNVNSAWHQGAARGKWVSYDQTDGTSVTVPNNWTLPHAIFVEVIDLTGITGIASADLHVWADDTAGVYMLHELPQSPYDLFNVLEQIHPPFPTQGTACANEVIGCTTTNGLHMGNIAQYLRPGEQNFLVFGAYQRDGGPYGLLYEGSILPEGNIPAAVPEPATLSLMGGALLGLAFWSRKRRTASSVK